MESVRCGVTKSVITYGTGSEVDVQARESDVRGLGMEYTVYWRGERLGHVTLQVPGIHHVQNSLAAVAVGLELGIPFSEVAEGLAAYKGVQRRFEVKGAERGVIVVDDYAHHPTEIRATIMTARACWPDRRLVVLFEPHRFSRTKALLHDFAPAFSEADLVWITEIYPASEEPIPGITGRRLAESVRAGIGGKVEYWPRCQEMAENVIPILREGDVVLTLGAGSIGSLAPSILELLKAKGRSAAAV